MRRTLCGISWLMIVAVVSGSAQSAVTREEVEFISDTLRMSGTLYLPAGPGPGPAVVLIHGSGAADRTSLRSYAELFARNGVAALAYDKRGVGRSQGPKLAWRNFSLIDLASDAAAAVRYLRARPDVDSNRVGLFGASQGGWVAPLAAQLSGNVRFVVTVSASLTTIAEDNLFERSARLRLEGFSDADVAVARRMHELDLEVSRSGAQFEAFEAAWDTNKSASWFKRVYLDERPAPPDHPYRRWYRSVMDFDPVSVWRVLKVPALFLFGDPALDRFGPVGRSMALAQDLRAAGRDIDVISFPGADHSFQKAGKDIPIAEPLLAWVRKKTCCD